MIIKPGKIIIQQVIVGLIAFISYLVIFLIETDSFVYGMLWGCIPLPLIVRLWIATGRTYIMDKTGCTVCVLWYKKTYCWDELKIKRYVTYEDFFGNRTRAAEFSPKYGHKPKRMESRTYSQLFHPLSYIYVYFLPDPPPKDAEIYSIIYETDEDTFQTKIADEDIFRAKMKEWM